MARIEESIEIKRSVDMVFVYTTDAKSWPKWWSILRASEQTSEGPLGAGTTFKGISHMMGVSMEWTGKTTEYEPPAKFGKDMISAAMITEQHNTYSAIEGGVNFTIRFDIKVRGIFKLFSPMLISTMRKELKKSLRNLKSVLEAQS